MEAQTNKRVAIITDQGFEEDELTSPKKALEEAGYEVRILSKQKGKVRGWKDGNWSIELDVDADVESESPENYDALVVPGGVINPDQMRRHEAYVKFAKHFLEEAKPLAAICHGPQLLIETGLLTGREMTSFASIKTDLKNAGVSWRDEEVVVDNGLVTSRSPKDLPAFNKKMLEEIREGKHQPSEA